MNHIISNKYKYLSTILAITVVVLAYLLLAHDASKTSDSGDVTVNKQHVVNDYYQNITRVYVGKSLTEAEAQAEHDDFRHRVISIDGNSQLITGDYDLYRINFIVANDIVTDIEFF